VNANGSTNGNATSFWSPYADRLLIPQLREMAGEYGVDGAWIDGECWASVPDYGEAAIQAFQKATGVKTVPRGPGQPHWFEFLQFHRDAFREYLRHYIAEVKKLIPDACFAATGARSHAAPVCARWTYSRRHFARRQRHSAPFTRYLRGKGKPWDLMAWSFTWKPDAGRPHPKDSPAIAAGSGGRARVGRRFSSVSQAEKRRLNSRRSDAGHG